jgi:hypothetical protein
MVFKCADNLFNESWNGKISNHIKHGNYYEIMIDSRSSIMVLFGKTSRGGFACMPDFGVGCHLITLNDRFWNAEKLVEVLGRTDGITVESALYKFADEVRF